ncbi:MAG: tetratricopeptide repeat-containing protein, partial [Deltaproteobacteria bacterium]|nr:tetratricopeptide repeat-containing protein [Deltaproteobacteria bacterium]
MKQKIEWYQEVLQLEPSSKVFFTLARMQAESGETEAALLTLRRGLDHNPDHIEARIFWVDMLFSQGRTEGVWAEVDEIALRLERYPGFWAAWSERLSKKPRLRDAALALRFFSAVIKGESVSWAEIIEQGMARMFSDRLFAPEAVLPAPKTSARKSSSSKGSKAKAESVLPSAKEENTAPSAKTVGIKSAPAAFPPAAAGRAAALPKTALFSQGPAPLKNETEDEEYIEEKFSLKTRSMAEVLAEQGDYAGALNIYEDLLREAGSGAEKAELEKAIARVNAEAGVADVAAPAEEKGEEDNFSGQP